jgi:hypothetical protein
MWTGFIWLRIRSSGGRCEHSNEIKDYVKGMKFLEWLSDY